MTKKLFAVILIVILITNTFLTNAVVYGEDSRDSLSAITTALMSKNNRDEIASGNAYEDIVSGESSDAISGSTSQGDGYGDITVSDQAADVGETQDSEHSPSAGQTQGSQGDAQMDKPAEDGNNAADNSAAPTQEPEDREEDITADVIIEDVLSSGTSQEIVTSSSAVLPVINSDSTPPYMLTLVTNGGTIDAASWQKESEGRYYSNTTDTGMITLPYVAYEGYTLTGWAAEENGEVVFENEAAIQLRSDLTLHAVWEINKYTVEFLEEEGGRPIWTVDIDYGYYLWTTLSQRPWLDEATVWTDDKATVSLNDEQIEVTRIPSGYAEGSYYYTFMAGNSNYFTVADGVIERVVELNSGYTFVDWYYEGYGHGIISGETSFYPRCINTSAFVANVSYQYQDRGTALPSTSHIIEFDQIAQEQVLTFSFTADQIVNYTPYISSDSREGVSMQIGEDIVGIDPDGDDRYYNFENNQYEYIIYIDVNEASFKKADGTIVGGEIIFDENNPDSADGIYYIDFELEYRPDPTGYTVRYFGEMLKDDGSGVDTNYYLMYMYDVISYDVDSEQWTATRYRAGAGSQIDRSIQSIENDDGTTVYYYAFAAGEYNEIADYQLDMPETGFHVGDEIQLDYPDVTGFSVDMNKRWAMYTLNNKPENQEDDSLIEDTTAIAVLYTKSPTVNLFYNRIEYYLYYATQGGNALDRVVLPYGAAVPDPGAVSRAGYVADKTRGTDGWEYHSISPTGELIGDRGEKPATMPAYNTYAVMNWKIADRTYHVRLWVEEANTSSYTVQTSFQVGVTAPADGTTPSVDVSTLVNDIKDENTANAAYTQIRDFLSGYGSNGEEDYPNVYPFFALNEKLIWNNNDYDENGQVDIAADGSTVINIYYSRNVYTLEFILARRTSTYNWWTGSYSYSYQVASNTKGSFSDATWTNANGTQAFPTINFDSEDIESEDKGNYTKYTLVNSSNSAYGIYTNNYSINVNNDTYDVAVYYIVAKYGADISKLWLVNGGSISINEEYTNFDYVSFGTDRSSKYFNSYGNPNILNAYSTMDNAVLLDNDDAPMSPIAGYGYDGTNKVSHRMVSYWSGNPPTYIYNYLYETLDNTDIDTIYAVNGANISQQGNPISATYTLNSIIQDTSNNTYYELAESNLQNSTNSIGNQNQPAKSGYLSRGKLFNTTGTQVTVNGQTINTVGTVYFFYDRNRYSISLHNVDGEYALTNTNLSPDEQADLLSLAITDLSTGGQTTLAQQGFSIENGVLTVKYGANLKYLADDEITKFFTQEVSGKLAYPHPMGNSPWIFGGWYLDNECEQYPLEDVEADMVNAVNSNVTLYAKWIPPTYNITYHLTEGQWDSTNVWANSLDPDYVGKTVTLRDGTTNVYDAVLDESDYMPQPMDPKAAGYSFYGWFYFTDEQEGDKVYLRDVLSAEERAPYSEGDVYIDLNHKLWRIYRDGNGLFYYNGEKASRYLYGTELIYTDLDIYAAWERTYSDQLEIWHMISQATADRFNVNVTGYDRYEINGSVYYLVTSETRSQQQSGVELSVSPHYRLKADSRDGSLYSLLPDTDFKRIILNEDDNPGATITGNIVTSAEDIGQSFYVKGTDDSLKYYLIFEYDLATSVNYRIWYIDYDEAVEGGLLTEGGSFSRDNPPQDYRDPYIFIQQPKSLLTNLTSDEESRVSVVGTVLPGYTLINNYQQELNLLSDGNKNNIYFYYRRNASDTTYTLELNIMDGGDNTYGYKSIRIENMPGVIGTTITAQSIADYFIRYLNEAIDSEGVNGIKPVITVTDENGTVTTYDLADTTLTAADKAGIIDMLTGTARDRDRGSSYMLINNNVEANTLTVYMRYGSINLKKTDVKGDPLWAKVRVERYIRDENGDLVLDDYIGEYEFKDGVIDLYGLYIDDEYVYRITELETTPGYSLLKEPIDITLPFMRGKDTAQTDGYDYRDQEGNYYWFDLSCTVANNTVFNVPITGTKPGWLYTVGPGIGLMYLSLALLLRRREQSG